LKGKKRKLGGEKKLQGKTEKGCVKWRAICVTYRGGNGEAKQKTQNRQRRGGEL